MRKLLIFVASVLLAACYCQTRTSCPANPSAEKVAPTHQPTQSPSAESTTQTTPTSTPQLVTTPQAVTPTQKGVQTQQKPAKIIVESSLPTTPVKSAPAFTPQAAQALITQARANQTLQAPPADKPVFKKEETLSTNGRLLSPLAYEPLLPDNTHAPWSNESLQYGLYYSFIKAGTAYIKTRGLVNKNGKTAYLIQTTAFSASVIDSVFKVRDINYSWLDANTFHSLGYSQSLREGNYKRDEWVTFDNENGHFYGQIQKKDEPRAIAGELEQEVLDMLTSLYFVRTKPLQVGQDVTFDIINREQQYPLVVKVLGKETVKTAAGKFNCWIVEPQFRGEGIFVAKGKSLKVWLTDDKYRMPVKMSVEVFIGSVTAELLAYQRN